MEHRRILLCAAALLFVAVPGCAQNLINRLSAIGYDPELNIQFLSLTDAEDGTVTRWPLPPGFQVGYLSSMDRFGDVWIESRISPTILKISGATGQVLATVNTVNRPTYLSTDGQGNLLVGSGDPPLAPQTGVYLQRYSPTGTLLATVDLRTLFPPGLFAPVSITNGVGTGIIRILVNRTGNIWLACLGPRYDPLIRLNPDFTLAGSYGVYGIHCMYPDQNDGVWVAYNAHSIIQQGNLNSPPLPGIPLLAGIFHMSGTGQLLEVSSDLSVVSPTTPWQSGHRLRSDGRSYHLAGGGGGAGVFVHVPGSTASGWMDPAHMILSSTSTLQYFSFSAVELDGFQRPWFVRSGNLTPGPDPEMLWTRYCMEPPYVAQCELRVYVGSAPFNNGWAAPATSQAGAGLEGNHSLYEFASYTDPYGDLDGDGVPNATEFANFSNPFLPFGFSGAATAVAGTPALGAAFAVTYSVPTDAGLPYVAPFALLGPMTQPLGGGWFLPVSLADPMVQLSLQPGVPGLVGTMGTLDSQGRAVAVVFIPPLPQLSGISFSSCILTRDPTWPLLFKTVSPPFSFLLP
jgi:hypothetical protein